MRYSITAILLLIAFTSQAQNSLDKVKNLFALNKKLTPVEEAMSKLTQSGTEGRFTGSAGAHNAASYIANRFYEMRYTPYLGNNILQSYKIESNNVLSEDSYVKIFGYQQILGSEVVVLPYGGNGESNALAIPGLNEPDNLWFIKFSSLGVELNNPKGDGARKMYEAADEAIKNGAKAVMFLNDVSHLQDFKQAPKVYFAPLGKPIWILNHGAYKKYILAQKEEEWVAVKYRINKTGNISEGENVVAHWSNKAKETIVIGAYYDYLGSQNKAASRQLHGADFNASGVAALLEVANFIAVNKLKNYNYLLIAYSGHEQGFIGAKDAVSRYNLDSSKINCMINIEGVGRLNNESTLYLTGTGTSPDWADMLKKADASFRTVKELPANSKSDAYCFYEKSIPVLSISTGKHGDKNTQKDEVDKINFKGIEMVAEGIGSILTELEISPKLRFSRTKEKVADKEISIRVSLGMQIDENFKGLGIRMQDLVENGTAHKSGAQVGDIIIRLDAYDVPDLDTYFRELSKYKKGDKIMMTVLRNKVKKQLLLSFD